MVLSFGASHRSRVPHDCKWCNLVERLIGLPNLRDIRGASRVQIPEFPTGDFGSNRHAVSGESHGPRTLELYRPSRFLPRLASFLVTGAMFVMLALAGCAQAGAGQTGAQYPPYPPDNNGNMPEHGVGGGSGM